MKPLIEIDKTTIDILESFLDNVMVYNSEGILLYACDKFWIDTRLTPGEFISTGKGIPEISQLHIFEPYAAEKAFQTGEKTTVVQEAFDKEITVATALPIRDKNGELFLIICYAENNNRIIELEEKLAQANQIIEKKQEDISRLLNQNLRISGVLGESMEVLKVHKLIEKIMDFDANVLLSGETGVGKTMYAERIHLGSSRKALPFVEINCAAIPETLLESELFGYEKGAFTGASESGKKGQIELAQGGTLFLDEINELSMKLQSKLLKVIQDKKILRIGGTKSIEVDFRLIAASNKDLEDLVRQGVFRSDLFYRLNVIPIQIPPLRERKTDIHPLAKQFLDRFNKKYKMQKYFGKDAIEFLMRYEWPGNVRELENTIERLVLTAENNIICVADMPPYMDQNMLPDISRERGMQDSLDRLEKKILVLACEETRGNISEMARQLGISRQSVLRRMEKYRIQKPS